jgi:hypothetical protein
VGIRAENAPKGIGVFVLIFGTKVVEMEPGIGQELH